jgi:hypothetical protein
VPFELARNVVHDVACAVETPVAVAVAAVDAPLELLKPQAWPGPQLGRPEPSSVASCACSRLIRTVARPV